MRRTVEFWRRDMPLEDLELRLKKRVAAAERTGRLDLASTPNCRFRFKKVPGQVYASFAVKGKDKATPEDKDKKTDKKTSSHKDAASSDGSTNSAAAAPLRELWLSNNAVSILTREIYSLSHLETLALSSNNLSSMPTALGDLPQLRRLLVDGNKITSVPPDIMRLRHITEIRLDGNRLSEFPLALTELITLRRLGLSRNKIGPSIPAQVRKLGNLVELDLDHNLIERLPLGLGFLHRTLQQLGLAFNRFSEVPAVVAELTTLDVLRLEGNRSHTRIDEETGENVAVYEIPVRHDGFAELRTGKHILNEDGSEEHLVQKLPGYLEEAFVYNRMNADWLREEVAGADVHEVGILKARARARRSRREAQAKVAEEKEAAALVAVEEGANP